MTEVNFDIQPQEVGFDVKEGGSGGSYTLPKASSTALGGVKADPKQTGDTQAVHIDDDGKLWTKPSGGGGGGTVNDVDVQMTGAFEGTTLNDAFMGAYITVMGLPTGATIEGKSLPVDNGKIVIPVANSEDFGAIKIQNYAQGLFLASNGKLCVYQAESGDISARTNVYRPITPNNLDFAVKTSLTDGKAMWTDSEKASARTLLGIDDLIGNATELAQALSEVVG